MSLTSRKGLRLLLKVDVHILLAVAALAYCWIGLDTISIKLAAGKNPGLSFHELLKYLNGDASFRGLIDLDSKYSGAYGAAMWLALFLPLIHCWYAHKYTFAVCAAPLAYMALCGLAVYGSLLRRVSSFSDVGAFVGGQRGRVVAEQTASGMLDKVWSAISFEAGLYVGLTIAAYLAVLGVVNYYLYKKREFLRA